MKRIFNSITFNNPLSVQFFFIVGFPQRVIILLVHRYSSFVWSWLLIRVERFSQSECVSLIPNLLKIHVYRLFFVCKIYLHSLYKDIYSFLLQYKFITTRVTYFYSLFKLFNLLFLFIRKNCTCLFELNLTEERM